MNKKAWIILLFPIVLLFSNCLNPVGFNPDSLPTLNINASGSEIGIDNINSAELRFVNHTKTMDIINIEMLIDGTANSGSYYSYGDSRISGGPQAGTSEGILQRPTGENATKSISVNGYKIIIEYRKNHQYDVLKSNANINTINWDGLDGSIIKIIGEYNRSDGSSWVTPVIGAQIAQNLLRGKQLLHFYRDINGQLQISTSDPDANEHDNYDFVDSSVIVNGNTNFNLDGIELAVTSFPAVNVNIPGLENFSTDVIDQLYNLHISIDNVKESLNLINSSIVTLGDYLNQGNLLLLRLTEGIENQSQFKEKYGSLSIYNGLTTKINSVYFIKQGELTKHFEINDISSQSVKGPSLNNEYNNIFVLAGNYKIGIVAEGYETFIGDYKIESYIGDTSTRLNIYAGPLPPNANPIDKYLTSSVPPITISYILDADGGPPAAENTEEYTTTEILITFTHDVSSFTFSGVTGTLTHDENDFRTWRIKTTPDSTQTVNIVINGTDIDTSPHQITIYKQNGAPSFIPVTDIQILNNEKFDKGVAKTLQWAVIPSNATSNTTKWTLGELDANLLLAWAMGQTPPYELLGGPQNHTNYTGYFIVRNNWNPDYWYVAAIVENGLAPGARNVGLHSVGRTIIDQSGTSYSVTVQELRFDPDKDFVKIFRLTCPDTALPPPPPPPQATTFDLTIVFGEPSNDTLAGIAYRPISRSGVPFNGRTGIAWATATNSLTYKSYFLKHINPTVTPIYFSPKIPSSGGTKTVTLDNVAGGYDIFFIEGDGRVRGYSNTFVTAPNKNDNMLFYIPGDVGNVTVTYSSKDNQANRTN
jgi:hypothetical protein